MRRKTSAYLTLYLALTLGVLIPLSLALIEGIRLNTLQLELTCVADIGTDCVFAEYNRALFQRFNILAIDTSYGTVYVGGGRLKERLEYYCKGNLTSPVQEQVGNASGWIYRDLLKMQLQEIELEGIRYLTDEDGAVFRQQAVEALKDDLGVTGIQETLDWLATVEQYQLDTRDIEAEKKKVDEEIASYQGKEIKISESIEETLDFEAPMVELENRKKTGILWQTLGEQELSGKGLNQNALIGQRRKSGGVLQGNLPMDEKNKAQSLMEKVAFAEYLQRYFGCFTQKREDSAMDYELEYVIAGKGSDAENLKNVLYRLLAIREAANATYLFADREKYEEAEIAALAVSVVLLVPELKDAFQTAILLGWAYAESVYDLRVLLEGGRIPLIKDKESWHYGLPSILEDVWVELWNGNGPEKEQEGLCYQDYLRILLLTMKEEDMTIRAMDMVEADVRQTKGNRAFRLDGCAVTLKCRIDVKSMYGYQLSCHEEKSY